MGPPADVITSPDYKGRDEVLIILGGLVEGACSY